MESHSTSAHASKSVAGFTLIELVVTIALIGLIATFGLFLSFDFYRGFAFLSEQKIMVSVLGKARNQAMSNINQQPHGVHFEAGKYVIFEGSTYNSSNSTNEEIKAQPTVSIPVLPSDILFDQLSGNSTATSFILTDGSKSFTFSIASNGRIDVQ